MSTQSTQATLKSVDYLTENIIKLELVPTHFIDYLAGQYLSIQLKTQHCFFSIANAPIGKNYYELHIRYASGDMFYPSLIEKLQQGDALTLSLPFGDCNLSHLDLKQSILFIASGTGFSPIQAMIEQLFLEQYQQPFSLIWGARSTNDLYMDKKVRAWQTQHPSFQYYPYIYNHESLIKFAQTHHVDLKQKQIILSGPFDLTYRYRDELITAGLDPSQLFSDAFAFERKK